MLTKNFKWIFTCFFFAITFIACSSDDKMEADETGEEIDTPDPDSNNTGCTEGKTAVFIEKDGLITIETESSVFENTSWKLLKTLSDYSGEGYLVWDGADSFNQPGNGLLSYKVRITNPGTYRFIWRSYIAIGTSNTDHNDNWLRIPNANHFYGKRNSDGNIVYPKDTQLPPIAESEGQTTTDPEGAGKDGWFKVYMNSANKWHWQSSTSDNNAHNIYVVFNSPGDYTIEISGRSNGHAIDKFVLFTENVTQNTATNDNASASEIKCE